MNKARLIFFIASAVVISSCSKKPEAKFTASNKTPLVDEVVSFTNSSTKSLTYLWDFGDGNSSTEQSPKHLYDTEGTYKVTLTAYTNGQKQWSEFSEIISVQHPSALFSGNVGGTDLRLFSGVNGDGQNYSVVSTLGTGTRSIIYTSKIGSLGVGQDYMGIDLGTLTVPDPLTLAATAPYFHSFIMVSDYPYSAAATNGVRIYYKTNSGVIWSTDNGIGDQSGSNFRITYTKDGTAGTTTIERFKAHFDCTLYDGLGGSMTITNGIFELDFGNL